MLQTAINDFAFQVCSPENYVFLYIVSYAHTKESHLMRILDIISRTSNRGRSGQGLGVDRNGRGRGCGEVVVHVDDEWHLRIAILLTISKRCIGFRTMILSLLPSSYFYQLVCFLTKLQSSLKCFGFWVTSKHLIEEPTLAIVFNPLIFTSESPHMRRILPKISQWQ